MEKILTVRLETAEERPGVIFLEETKLGKGPEIIATHNIKEFITNSNTYYYELNVIYMEYDRALEYKNKIERQN